MRRTKLVLPILLFVFLLGFGCLEEKEYAAVKTEQLAGTQSVDLDNDGITDYYIYDFTPVTPDGAGMRIQRHVSVSVATNSAYTSINPALTDVDLLVADQSLDEFSKSRIQSDTQCSASIGLSNVVCADAITCSRLCSSASMKCKKIAASYEEPLAGAMISYVQDNSIIKSRIVDARRMVLDLREASSEDQNTYLMKTREMVASVASINANPLYNSPELALCTHSDFGIQFALDAAAKLGNYTTAPSNYRYRVVMTIKPAQQTDTGQTSLEIAGVGVTDRLPKTIVPQPDQSVSSSQQLTLTEETNNAVISWSSSRPSKEGYLFEYEFTSSQPPETYLSGLKSPELKTRKVNLMFLAPTAYLLTTINSMTHNYYIAYGAAVGLTVALLIFFYNVGLLAYHILIGKTADTTLTTAFRKAFGRTVIHWRMDLVLAIVFLGGGYYVSTVIATAPASTPPLIESVDFLIRSDMSGMLGIAMILVGTILAYYAVENIVKIIILESAYGMVIRKEKDMFLARAADLKNRINELESLIEEYTKDDFDVSKEYDILTSLKAAKVELLTKETTARNKALVDEYLGRAESAVSSLKERKRIADENWPKWKDSIAKLLEEQNEVYVSSLISVPASLRAWALGRYVKEVGAEGIIFERDSLRKKKIAPQQVIRDMIDKEILKGAIVLRQDKIIASEFAEGSGTVMSALVLKLNSYTQSLAKNVGQHPPQSFVAIGDKSVIVMMKNRVVDGVLFLSKDKFKDAIEQWKVKLKALEAV